MVVDTYEATSEGEYLAEGNENTVMNLSHRWGDKAASKQRAPEGAHCY